VSHGQFNGGDTGAMLMALAGPVPPLRVIVVCQNDFPIAVVMTPEAADRIKAEKHRPDGDGQGGRAVFIHFHEFDVQR
jgi:hypothetical protein